MQIQIHANRTKETEPKRRSLSHITCYNEYFTLKIFYIFLHIIYILRIFISSNASKSDICLLYFAIFVALIRLPNCSSLVVTLN